MHSDVDARSLKQCRNAVWRVSFPHSLWAWKGLFGVVLPGSLSFDSLKRGMNMQTELLRISGMTCGGCIGTVTHALKAIAGVGEVNVSLSAGEATVKYDEKLTSPEKLKSAVKGAGYGVDMAAAHGHKSKSGCCS